MTLEHTHVTSQTWYAQWYETNLDRLLIEKEAMRKRFPGFEMVKMDDGKLAWMGALKTNSGNKYEIAVIYPPNFPHRVPLVYPVNPQIEVWDEKSFRVRHQYSDGHLCLYYPGDRTFHADTTATVVVGVAAAWFFAYEYWLTSGKREWPGPEAD